MSSAELSEDVCLTLFADEHGRAYSASALDKRYTALLQHVLPKSASLYSMHSHRIRLACRLRRVNASDARIQAMCRWMSPESLHIYARWDIHKYAKWVQRSRKANATTLETTNMPMIGETLSGKLNPNLVTPTPFQCSLKTAPSSGGTRVIGPGYRAKEKKSKIFPRGVRR